MGKQFLSTFRFPRATFFQLSFVEKSIFSSQENKIDSPTFLVCLTFFFKFSKEIDGFLSLIIVEMKFAVVPIPRKL